MKVEPNKLVLISAIIAIDISKDKSVKEINTYKNLFSAISTNLQTILNQIACN